MTLDEQHIYFSQTPPLSGVVTGLWLWMRLCFSGFWPFETGYEYEYEETLEIEDSFAEPNGSYCCLNRHQRRRAAKTLPRHLYSIQAFCRLLPRGLSRGEFTERCARLSIYGRRRCYFILNWLKHLSRTRQILICGGVKEQNSFHDLSMCNGGLWEAHLWPS